MKKALILLLAAAPLSGIALAQSVQFSSSYGLSSELTPGSEGVFTFSGFDTSLGTLTSVNVHYTGSIVNNTGYEWTGDSPLSGNSRSNVVFTADINVKKGLVKPGITPNNWNQLQYDFSSGYDFNTTDLWNTSVFESIASDEKNIQKLATVPAYDGVTDFAGASGESWGPTTLSQIDTNYNYTDASDLAFFTSNGDVTLYDFATAITNATTTGGNAKYKVTTFHQGSVVVTYNYSPVPEPSSAALLALGGLACLTRRKRR